MNQYYTSCDLSSKRYDRSIQRKCPCITGFYEDENQNCQRCHIKCYDCINSSEICTSCNYKVNSNRNSLSQQCNCKEGYYDDVTQIQCQKCNNKCKKCLNDSINCSICNNNLRSNPPVCNCIDGYFEDEYRYIIQLQLQQTCQPCYHQCSINIIKKLLFILVILIKIIVYLVNQIDLDQIVNVQMDIMKLDQLIVQNVNFNVKLVLMMQIYVSHVKQIEFKLLFVNVQMVNMMIIPMKLVKIVTILAMNVILMDVLFQSINQLYLLCWKQDLILRKYM